jgi:phage replication-related protein YjqB (UPF0714/DUF867 family)
MDKYSCFEDLKSSESSDDYRIEYCDRADSSAIVIAPHGGKIEPLTCDIARRIAGSDFSYYTFLGRKKKSNRDLHITSHRFDEPEALALVAKHRWAVAIHGCRNAGVCVFVGGRDDALADDIARELDNIGIKTVRGDQFYAGCEKNNICNRGSSGAGVQLELSMPFRKNQSLVEPFVRTIRMLLMERTSGSIES